MKEIESKVIVLRIIRNITGSLFIVSVATVIAFCLDYYKMDRHNEEIRRMAIAEDTELTISIAKMPEGEQKVSLPVVDFKALKRINEYCVGWIYACDGEISYPVVASQDEYYLHHAVDGKESKSGSIYADVDKDEAFENQRTVIYGHNMKDGSMFHPLLQYWQRDGYLEEHPNIYIITEETVYTYKIKSVYVKEYEMIDFSEEQDLREENVINLITCEYSGKDTRLVIEAVQG